jgi:hypothetical protein
MNYYVNIKPEFPPELKNQLKEALDNDDINKLLALVNHQLNYYTTNNRFKIGETNGSTKFYFMANGWKFYDESFESIIAFLRKCDSIQDANKKNISVEEFIDIVNKYKDYPDYEEYFTSQLERYKKSGNINTYRHYSEIYSIFESQGFNTLIFNKDGEELSKSLGYRFLKEDN